MEQHQVRLGDVLDDYCPRERRVTNHAGVAIVGDEIKLTRCTTCDNEHPYKEAKVPPRRQTKLVAALSKSEDGPTPALAATAKQEEPAPAAVPAAPSAATTGVDDTEPVSSPPPPPSDSMHRPLIRASLALPEGAQPPARVPPVFTIRESGRDAILERGASGNVAPTSQQPSRKRRNGRSGGEVNGNRSDGHQGQTTRQGQNKNDNSRSSRNRNSGNRAERQNRGQRNRGKGRSR